MIMLLSFVGCSLACAHSASYCDDGALCAIVVYASIVCGIFLGMCTLSFILR